MDQETDHNHMDGSKESEHKKYKKLKSKKTFLRAFGNFYTVRNYLHGLQNSGESIEDSDLHADFGPVTW